MNMPTIRRLESGYWSVRWSEAIWAQWPTSFWAPRSEDFFVPGTGTAKRISEASACVGAFLRAEGRDPVEVYTEIR